MSHDPSRKRFLASVFGLTAAGVIVPGTVAKALVPALPNKESGKSVSFRIRPQPRAVARRGGMA